MGRLAGRGLDWAVDRLLTRSVAELRVGTASYLNWAAGHRGFAAQSGVWFQPPIYVEHRGGAVVPNHANERIVEVPYAAAVAARLAAGSHVLDFGAAESTLAVSMASLGLRVVALDPRGYPLNHPLLTVVASRVEEWTGPDEPFAAIFSISTLEHVGLGSYGLRAAPLDHPDRVVLDLFRRWLRPDGELVITLPYGRRSVNEFERVYDREQLDDLLADWEVLDRRVCIHSDPLTWELGESELEDAFQEEGRRAVMMLRARPTR